MLLIFINLQSANTSPLMLVTLLTLVLEDDTECNIADFVDAPADIQTGLSYQITEKGIMIFFNNSLDLLLPKLYSYDIPN